MWTYQGTFPPKLVMVRYGEPMLFRNHNRLPYCVTDNGGLPQLVAWKESGGFAGTFSPNAAFVQATFAMASGHTYVFSLWWKTNIAAPGRIGAHELIGCRIEKRNTDEPLDHRIRRRKHFAIIAQDIVAIDPQPCGGAQRAGDDAKRCRRRRILEDCGGGELPLQFM